MFTKNVVKTVKGENSFEHHSAIEGLVEHEKLIKEAEFLQLLSYAYSNEFLPATVTLWALQTPESTPPEKAKTTPKTWQVQVSHDVDFREPYIALLS